MMSNLAVFSMLCSLNFGLRFSFDFLKSFPHLIREMSFHVYAMLTFLAYFLANARKTIGLLSYFFDEAYNYKFFQILIFGQ